MWVAMLVVNVNLVLSFKMPLIFVLHSFLFGKTIPRPLSDFVIIKTEGSIDETLSQYWILTTKHVVGIFANDSVSVMNRINALIITISAKLGYPITNTFKP